MPPSPRRRHSDSSTGQSQSGVGKAGAASPAVLARQCASRSSSFSSGRGVFPKILPRDRRQVLEKDVCHLLLFVNKALAHLLQVAPAQFFGGAEHGAVSRDL